MSTYKVVTLRFGLIGNFVSTRPEIPEDEIVEILELLERLNNFFHEPMNFEGSEAAASFAQSVYPEVNKAYYETVWNWLSESRREKFIDR